MRVAFFGGSFDPPHLGHLRIAQAAASRLQLDRVLLAPVALQPLKQGLEPPATFVDRLAMLRLMVEHACDPRLEVSEIDAPRPNGTPNYTYDTVLRLRETLTPEDKIFVLTGADSLLTLPQWSRALDLVLATDFIVATRPGFPLASLYQALLALSVPSVIDEAQPQAAGVKHLILTPGAKLPPRTTALQKQAHIYILTNLHEQISATAIRSAIALHELPDPPPLPPPVMDYIHEHALYR